MTQAQKLELRRSEVRERLAEIAGLEGEAFTEEIEAESKALQTEYRTLESRARAALIAESAEESKALAEAEGGEGREYRELVGRADLGALIAGVIEGRSQDGAVKELQEHCKVGGNQVPLDMLREVRDVTPAPAQTGQSQAEILQPVYARSAAAFLGIEMPSVPAAARTFPVLTTRATVGGPVADSTPIPETTGAFSTTELSPERIQASFFWRRTDAARLAGMGEALRMALSASLEEALDAQIIGASGTIGLLAGNNLAAVDGNPDNSAATYTQVRKGLVFSRIDGRYAVSSSDLRILLGASSYEYFGGLFQTQPRDRSLVEDVEDLVDGMLRVSAHVPAIAAKHQFSLIRRGSRMGEAVAPMWEGPTVIVDPYTRADTGEIKVTVVQLFNFAVIRAESFAKVAFQLQP